MTGAGLYREKIEIQRYESIQQPDFTYVDTWTVLLSTWCHRKMEKGGLENIFSQQTIIQPFTFNIRYREDVDLKNGDRVIYRGKYFKIHYFDWNVSRTELKIFVVTDNNTTSS